MLETPRQCQNCTKALAPMMRTDVDGSWLRSMTFSDLKTSPKGEYPQNMSKFNNLTTGLKCLNKATERTSLTMYPEEAKHKLAEIEALPTRGVNNNNNNNKLKHVLDENAG